MKRRILTCSDNNRLIESCSGNPRLVPSCDGYESYIPVVYYGGIPQIEDWTYYAITACNAGTKNTTATINYSGNTYICSSVPGAPTIAACAHDFTNPPGTAPQYRNVDTIFGTKPIISWGSFGTGQPICLGINRTPPSQQHPLGRTVFNGFNLVYYRPSTVCRCLVSETYQYSCPCCSPYHTCTVQGDNLSNAGAFHEMYLPCQGGNLNCNGNPPADRNAAYRDAIRDIGKVQLEINVEKYLTDGELWNLATSAAHIMFYTDLRPFISLVELTFVGVERSWGRWTGSPYQKWNTYEITNGPSTFNAGIQYDWPFTSYYYAGWRWDAINREERFGYIPLSNDYTCQNESSTANYIDTWEVFKDVYLMGSRWASFGSHLAW